MTNPVGASQVAGPKFGRAGDPAITPEAAEDERSTGRADDRGPRLWVVVLAGGQGTRLQRFLRQALGCERPKQFCRIVGSRSMLRHTWDRALRIVNPDQIVTIITAGQEAYLDDEVPRGVPGTVLVQPVNRGTAPGLVFPLLWIARRDPTAIVAVLPADHFVLEEERFVDHVHAALAAAQRWPGRLAILGVEADAPDEGYGWIAPGRPLAGGPQTELYAVRRFWEKPDRRTAASLLACGHFWNTLVMAGHLNAYLSLAAAWVPEILGPLRAADDPHATPVHALALHKAYRNMRATNLSEAVLARHPDGLMVVAARGICWSDWGDPDRILRTLRRFAWCPEWLPAYTRASAQELTAP